MLRSARDPVHGSIVMIHRDVERMKTATVPEHPCASGAGADKEHLPRLGIFFGEFIRRGVARSARNMPC